jgi:solute carrier family 25 uncoupling protein 27
MATLKSNPVPVVKLDPYSAFLIKYGLSCSAAMFAETATYPLDITKTRLQVSTKDPLRRGGMIRMAYNIGRKEGILSLWQGLGPAILRHYIYTGIRIGLYELIRDNWFDKSRENIAIWLVFNLKIE